MPSLFLVATLSVSGALGGGPLLLEEGALPLSLTAETTPAGLGELGVGAGGVSLSSWPRRPLPFDAGVMLSQGVMGLGGAAYGGIVGAVLWSGPSHLWWFPSVAQRLVVGPAIPLGWGGLLIGAWLGAVWAVWATGEALGMSGDLGATLLSSLIFLVASGGFLAFLGVNPAIWMGAGGISGLAGMILGYHLTSFEVSGYSLLGTQVAGVEPPPAQGGVGAPRELFAAPLVSLRF